MHWSQALSLCRREQQQASRDQGSAGPLFAAGSQAASNGTIEPGEMPGTASLSDQNGLSVAKVGAIRRSLPIPCL